MRTLLRWAMRLILVIVLAAVAVGLWKRDEIKRLLAVNSLFSQEKIVHNFSNMNAAFLHRPVPRGDDPVSPLMQGPRMDLPAGTQTWIKDRAVTSLLVLKDGKIAHESYHLGTGPDDLRISWSMAKSYLSALMGILVDQGVITSLDAPVTRYAPALSQSAYADATIRNVLNMASGVTFDEDYLDYDSDINRMGRVLALGGKMDDFTAALTQSFAAPGTDWQYVSIDTHVIGMVIRGATGRSIADLLSEHVIAPLGLEREPYYLTDGVGVAFVLGGLNVTTRDYARFGQMILQGGEWQGRQIVPRDWILASTQPSAPTDAGESGYGYQWWIPNDASPREYMARGVYGQYIYINEPLGTVIVTTGADRAFREDGIDRANVEMFRQIARQP